MIFKNEHPIAQVYDYKEDSKKLGEGTYGKVVEVKHLQSGAIRACKMIPRTKIKNWERFHNEVSIMQTLDHPNILKLYEYFEDQLNVYLVTELCSGGELFDKIIENEHFEEDFAAKIFKQIMQAICYCHA